jgi:hypothetical protein
MRMGRLLAEEGAVEACCHCVTRVVERRFAFGDREKEKFVEILRAYEECCGVQVLTFCVLSNHVHVLVHVPKRPESMPDDAELVRLVRRPVFPIQSGSWNASLPKCGVLAMRPGRTGSGKSSCFGCGIWGA